MKKILGRLTNSVLAYFGLAIHTIQRQKIETKETDNSSTYCDIFLSPWTDSWKNFYVKNFNTINFNLDKLKLGMDEESKEVIDTLWEKMIFLIPYNKYKKSFLYKVSDFFTAAEIKDQKQKIDLGGYKLPNDVNIEASVFASKNGLIFLDNKITSQIKGRAVIDGGAYIGDSALIFIEHKPSKIYSFEPIDFLFQKLKETLKLNNIGGIVEPVKLGLSNKITEVKIYGKDSGSSLYRTEKELAQVIKTITVDDFAKNRKLDVGLIKMDIEGSELEAIEGSLETIKTCKPILLISIYHRPEDFFFIKLMIENLDLGYKFMVRKTSPFRVTAETVLIGYIDKNAINNNV